MTKIIGGTVLDTNLQPISSCPIEIELIQAQGFVVIGKQSLAPKMTVQTGPAGTWTATVVENDAITPAGTLYKITEKIPSAHGGSKTYNIQVLTSLGGGTNQILDLIVPALSVAGTINTYLTKAYADATYATLGTPGSAGPPGPPGSSGGSGAAGYITVSNRAALDALTPVSGLIVLQTDRMIYWTWSGSKYVPVNEAVFTGSAQRDANYTGPSIGDAYYQDVNTIAEGPFWRTHAGTWRQPWHMPWGEISYGEITSNSATFTTTEVDVNAALSKTFTHVANRRLNVIVSGLCQSDVGGDLIAFYITDGSNTHLKQYNQRVTTASQSEGFTFVGRTVGTGSSQSIKLRANRAVGTGNCSVLGAATFPASIQILDVGPSGAPA